MKLRTLLFAAALVAAVPALATPQHKLATGLWIDPTQSGWGLNLFHQGNTVFGSLFVYGPDGQPRWYTASAMTNFDDGPIHDHPTTVVGDLYESTGPYFGGPFDPTRVARRKVGTMNIDLGNNLTGLQYTIDGVTVTTNNLVPLTFRRDDLSGDYVGYQWQPPASEFTPGPEILKEVTIHIVDNGSTVTMSTADSGVTCNYSGTRSQNRDSVGASGTHTCSNGTSGPWAMAADVTPDGFIGSFNGNGITSIWGRMSASRTGPANMQGNGWRNDLWFPANEPGWGINILDQGDTLFATLFVYDASGRSHWYSASQLAQSGPTHDGTYIYSGPLVESTGPYYGASFNPAAVTRRTVGTMSFEVRGGGFAFLNYTVDGVSVSKGVNRYAFTKNNFSGTYVGHQVAATDDPGGARSEAMTITINDNGNEFLMQTQAASGSCSYRAPMSQSGELRLIVGTFSCSNGRNGQFELLEALVSWGGFSALFQGNGISIGHMEGVRRERN